MTAAEIGLVRCRVDDRYAAKTGALANGKVDTDFSRDLLCYFALQGQNVTEVAVVFFGPKMLICTGINQLCGDADAISGANYGAFDHRIRMQLLRDFLQGELGPFVALDGGVRNDAQVRNLGQFRYHFVGNAVAEELLFGIVGKIAEGKYRDRAQTPGVGGGRRVA